MRERVRAARGTLLPALLLALLLGVAAGCGSNDTYSPAVPGGGGQQPDFTLSISPSSRTVTQGQQTTYTITVRPVGGFASAVSLTLDGAPDPTTTYFKPATVYVDANGESSLLTVVTSAPGVEASGTPTGTHALTVTGTGGGLTHSAAASLVVNPVVPGSLQGTIQ